MRRRFVQPLPIDIQSNDFSRQNHSHSHSLTERHSFANSLTSPSTTFFCNFILECVFVSSSAVTPFRFISIFLLLFSLLLFLVSEENDEWSSWWSLRLSFDWNAKRGLVWLTIFAAARIRLIDEMPKRCSNALTDTTRHSRLRPWISFCFVFASRFGSGHVSRDIVTWYWLNKLLSTFYAVDSEKLKFDLMRKN